MTLFLVGLGGYVRSTNAGLSCPDWPLCFGKLIPESFENGVGQEYFHRVIATFVGILVIVLNIFAYKLKDTYVRLFKFTNFLLILVIIQGIFGGLTVTQKLNPLIVTTHLILGTVFLQAVLYLATSKDKLPNSDVGYNRLTIKQPRYRKLIYSIIALTFLQIAVGGYVGSSGASLVCSGLPFCHGSICANDICKDGFAYTETASKAIKGLTHIHMTHRVLGILLAILVFSLVPLVIKNREFPKAGRGHAFGMATMILLQIIIGVLNIVFKVQTHVTVTHLVIAQFILFGFLILYRDMNPEKSILLKN